jgi:prepilin-type N-terminal cleavage/methylation domain-containing protein
MRKILFGGTTTAQRRWCIVDMKIHSHNSIARNRAFTLVEVVISTVIISIVAAALMGCFNFAFFIMRMARENQRATQIMLERTEALRLWNWDKMSSTYVPTTFSEYYDPTATNGSQGTVYSGSVSIDSFPYSSVSYATNMLQITVIVQWQTGDITRSRTNVTFVAKDGLQNYVY